MANTLRKSIFGEYFSNKTYKVKYTRNAGKVLQNTQCSSITL